MSRLSTMILTGAVISLTACATATPALEDNAPTFGQANAHNRAAQFVPPTPEQKANTYIPASRARQILAKSRYDKDEVEEPMPSQTTQ